MLEVSDDVSHILSAREDFNKTSAEFQEVSEVYKGLAHNDPDELYMKRKYRCISWYSRRVMTCCLSILLGLVQLWKSHPGAASWACC